MGVFDGHGGKEAAKFAKERLWDIIQAQPKFRIDDVQSVRDGIQSKMPTSLCTARWSLFKVRGSDACGFK